MAFIRVPVGSLPQGPKGDQGDQGNPGVNSVANDDVTASQINDNASATRAALRRTTTMNGGLYTPTQYAGLRWRTRLTQIRSGFTQGHIAIVGDSIAGTAGPLSSPKYKFNWPGRLRQMLDNEFGPAGTGLVICDWDIRATPAYDDRFTYGTPIDNAGYGFFSRSAFQLNASSYLDFTAHASEFWVLNLSSASGVNTAYVGGVSAGTFANVAGGGAVTLPKEADTHWGHLLTKIPAGTVGTRALSIAPPAGTFATIAAVEGRIPTPGTIRVSNISQSGESIETLFAKAGYNDETTGQKGLPFIDTIKADLLVVALGINDWSFRKTTAQLKIDLGALITRQMASGTNEGGGTKAAGDVLLVWNPQPDLDTLPAGSSPGPTWQEFRDAFYEVSDTYNVPLLDMGERWKDFITANSMGLFGDGIHPNDAGSYDIAPAVRRAILNP